MKFDTTSKEASMFRKHLTRLSVMVITGSITIAMYADLASAALRGRG